MLLLRWLLNAFALIVVSLIVPGFHIANFWAALVATLILGLVNAVVRPLLLLLTLPINILTLGLFTFVINASMILLVSTIVRGFTVDNFTAAFFGGIVLWLISLLSNVFVLE